MSYPRTESQRERNRLYMRAWRADPRHRESLRKNRERWRQERKLRIVEGMQPEPPTCGFCHRDPPVCQVNRLLIAADRFIPVRVPWCGNC